MGQGSIAGGNPLEDIHTRTTTTGPQSQAVVLGIDGSDSVVTSHATRGVRVDAAGTSISDGRTTIATAGTAAQLNGGSSVPCKAVMVIALPTNTQRVAIGSSAVDAATSTFRGIPLDPFQGQSLEVSDVNLIYLDVLGDGHGVTWMVIA